MAQKILGEDMPQPEKATRVVANYDERLSELARQLTVRKPKPGSYDDQALQTWKRCIRDRAAAKEEA